MKRCDESWFRAGSRTDRIRDSRRIMVLVYKARAASVCCWQPITTVQTRARWSGTMAKALLNTESCLFLRNAAFLHLLSRLLFLFLFLRLLLSCFSPFIPFSLSLVCLRLSLWTPLTVLLKIPSREDLYLLLSKSDDKTYTLFSRFYYQWKFYGDRMQTWNLGDCFAC